MFLESPVLMLVIQAGKIQEDKGHDLSNDSIYRNKGNDVGLI